MKTLVNEINGRKDFPNFQGSNKAILNWVKENICDFDLNESHSCKITLENDIIEIRGDEDSETFRIVDVYFINLN